jgi:hypothetical protein
MLFHFFPRLHHKDTQSHAFISSIYRLDSGGPLQTLKWKEQRIQTTRLCKLSVVTYRTSKKIPFQIKIIIIILIIIIVLTAIEFSLGGSSPYTSTDKTKRIKCI